MSRDRLNKAQPIMSLLLPRHQDKDARGIVQLSVSWAN